VSPAFTGTFNTWFIDGQRFLTNTGNVVWTYSNTAIQQDLTSVTTVAGLAGEGDWFWTFDGQSTGGTGTLSIYQVGASGSPTSSTLYGAGAYAIPSGGTIGVLSPGTATVSGTGRVTIVDLSGAAPASTSYTVPYSSDNYAAISSAQWVVGDDDGVIFDGASLGGTPRTLTLGAATSIAGGTSYFSVATASGTIFNYRTADDSLVGTISFPGVQRLSASSDGTVLAAAANTNSAQYVTGRPLNIYSLPSGAVLTSFSYSYPAADLSSIALSGSGTLLTEHFGAGAQSDPCSTQVIPIMGGAPFYCDTTGLLSNVQVSPDSTLLAAEQQASSSSPTTNIYKNGTLISAVPGTPITWIDNNDLLLDQYPLDDPTNPPMAIYTSSGALVGNGAPSRSIGCDSYTACQIVSSGLIYTSGDTIQSYITGSTTWESADYNPAGVGALAGSQIIVPSSVYVLALPY
jgi:hypothetical protein